MKVAIIGNENIVMPLKSLGIEIIDIKNRDEGKIFFQKINDSKKSEPENQYGVIFITSDWYKILEQEIIKFKNQTIPAIISLPSPTEKKGATLAGLEKMMERAIGSKLILKT